MASQKAKDKTNVMRILEQNKIAYKAHEYPHGQDAVDGVTVAKLLGEDPAQVFKTLVTRGSKGYYVFVLPVAEELNLKKAARAVGEKAVEMIHVKEMLGITGYIRGGCSPIGMKKKFPTYIEETAQLYEAITVSAGQRGVQITLNPEDLRRYVDGVFAALI